MDQCVLYQEYGGGLIRKLGQKGIDSLVAVYKLRGDVLHERFNNVSSGNDQPELNICQLVYLQDVLIILTQ